MPAGGVQLTRNRVEPTATGERDAAGAPSGQAELGYTWIDTVLIPLVLYLTATPDRMDVANPPQLSVVPMAMQDPAGVPSPVSSV